MTTQSEVEPLQPATDPVDGAGATTPAQANRACRDAHLRDDATRLHHHEGGVFTEPVAPRLERAARRVSDRTADRSHGAVKAPAFVAFAGLIGLFVVLLALGELIVHLGALSAVRDWDESINRSFVGHRTSMWNHWSAFWTQAADTVPVIVIALVVEVVLYVRKRRRDLLLLPIGLAVELITFLAVNEIVRRARPDVPRVGITPGTFSYPSGHIAATVVLYGSIALLITLAVRSTAPRWAAWLAWAIVVAFTVSVGLSRVYRGMHHPLDVLVGLFLGFASLLVAVVATRASALVPFHRTGSAATREEIQS